MSVFDLCYGVCVGELGCDRVDKSLFADAMGVFILESTYGLASAVGLRFVLNSDNIHYFDGLGVEVGKCEGALGAYCSDFVYIGCSVPTKIRTNDFCTFDEKCISKLVKDYRNLLGRLKLIGIRGRRVDLRFFMYAYGDY